MAGFAAHGTGAYTWWGHFLHGFVVPNSGWIATLVAVAEFMIGFTYVMSGTASVCAFYALIALVLLATWRTSSWLGVDGPIAGYRHRRPRGRPWHRGSGLSRHAAAAEAV